MSDTLGSDTADYCATLVRDRDRDRWLATLYSPVAVRPALFALHALDLELAGVIASTTEAMLGEIRLAWWRESLTRLDDGAVPAQPVLAALARHVLPLGVSGRSLEPLEDAFLSLLIEQRLAGTTLTSHVERRGGSLFGAAATVLGVAETSARRLGRTWALGELVRPEIKAPPVDPGDATALAAESVSPVRLAAPLRPLAALAGYAARDVRTALAGGTVGVRGSAGRQARLLWTVATGR
ncbi:MAG: squalene/phytoene synthase family protein [Janthinobacterium lividum]